VLTHGDECVVDVILRFVAILGAPHRDAEENACVTVEEKADGLTVACLEAAQQRVIRRAR
jgi:hypothetical protein